MPASATTVTTASLRSAATCRNTARIASSSASRPTMRVATPSMPRVAPVARVGMARCTSQLRIGASTPLTRIGSWATTSNRSRTRAWVSLLMRKAPGGAVCSIRAAMLTARPRMLPSPSTPPPSSTPPVWMPTRTPKPAWPCAACTSLAEDCPSASRARPQRTARSGSSSRTSSAPKAASRLSPAYCSTLPRCDSTMALKRASAPSTTAWISSGSRCCDKVVEPTRSRNRMLTWRSAWSPGTAAPASSASRARRPAIDASTTASPRTDRCASSAAMPACSCCSGDMGERIATRAAPARATSLPSPRARLRGRSPRGPRARPSPFPRRSPRRRARPGAATAAAGPWSSGSSAD